MLTHKSAHWLPYVLPPLQKSVVKFIAVDSGADNSAKIIRQYFPDAIIIQDKSSNLAYLRNLALRESEKHESDYTAFIDSDMVMPDNFFERTISFLEEHKDAGAVYVGGILNFDPPKTFVAKFWRNIPEPNGTYEKKYACTTSIMFKTEAIKGIVINENCDRGNEDADLSLKLRRKGYKVFVDNNAPVAVHLRPATIMEELKRYYNFGKTKPTILFEEGDKLTVLKTILVDIFALIGLLGIILSPFIGTLALIPIVIIFIRQTFRLKKKWRLDHALFMLILSLVYNISCLTFLLVRKVSK
ncbi:MAG: glycosyltransferase [Candidatus Bathyarchaeia archaeon]